MGKAFPADLSAYFHRGCKKAGGGDDRKEEESRLTPRIHGLLNFSAGRSVEWRVSVTINPFFDDERKARLDSRLSATGIRHFKVFRET